MSTEPKFTPGPYEEVEEYGGIFARGIECYGLQICERPGQELEGHAAWEHNKHLLMAAPDLYAALEAIVAWGHSEDGPFAWEVLEQAKSALAKARGEA